MKKIHLINTHDMENAGAGLRIISPGMQRASVYPYTVKNSPGVNIHRLRTAFGWPMRELAEKCHPPLNHTTVRRLEHNKGFTQDTIERVAKALQVTH